MATGDNRDIAVVPSFHPPHCECGLCIYAHNKNKQQVKDQRTFSALYPYSRPERSNGQRAKEKSKFQQTGPFFKNFGKRRKELERISQDVVQVRDLQCFEEKTAFQQSDCCCCCCCEESIQSTKPISFQDEILPMETVGDSAAKPTRYHEEIFPGVTIPDANVRPAHHIIEVVDNTAALPDHCHEVGTVKQRTYGLLDCLAILAIIDTAVHLTYGLEDTVPDVTFDDSAVQSIFYQENIPPAATVSCSATQTTSSNDDEVYYDDDAMYGILGVYSNRI